MSGSSRFGQLTSAQTGEIERRLQALEKRLNEIGARASTNSRDIVRDLGDVIASALSTWADRFGSETKVDSARWLQLRFAFAVGLLVGMAVRTSSRR
jgi:hypothetical protein